jgi:hypothetical protein
MLFAQIDYQIGRTLGLGKYPPIFSIILNRIWCCEPLPKPTSVLNGVSEDVTARSHVPLRATSRGNP